MGAELVETRYLHASSPLALRGERYTAVLIESRAAGTVFYDPTTRTSASQLTLSVQSTWTEEIGMGCVSGTTW